MNKSSSLFSLLDYKQTIFKISGWLRQLRSYSNTLGLVEIVESIDDVLNRVESNSFEVAVVGEFKRGKSTLINALLGKNILPSDILPTTATLNRITYGLKDQVTIRFKDKKEETIEINQLHKYVTKLTPEAEVISATVQEAVIYYPLPYCQNNVDIIDTPGLSDEAAMTETTLAVIPHVDAAIFVVMAQSPFSESERFFLENHLLKEDLGRIIFVVTGIDRCNKPEDVDKILKSVEARIRTYVLQGAEERYGKDSQEYKGYISRIGHPKVFGVSAYEALVAKESGNVQMLEKSRFQQLEEALERFLAEERGIIFLQVPINRIINVSNSILTRISLQNQILVDTQNSLRADYENAIASLNEEQINLQKSYREHQNVINTLEKRLSIVINQLETSLKQSNIEILDTMSLTSYDFNQAVIAERMVNLDQKIGANLELHSRRIAGKLQQELQRGIDNIPENLKPGSEHTSQLIRQIGLLHVNFGSALKRAILQQRLAWNTANETVGGVDGWLKQTFQTHDVASTFKEKYKLQINETIAHKVKGENIIQNLSMEMSNFLKPLKFTEAFQSSTLQEITTEKRIQLERNETRTELENQSLQRMKQSTSTILNDANQVLEQLLSIAETNIK